MANLSGASETQFSANIKRSISQKPTTKNPINSISNDLVRKGVTRFPENKDGIADILYDRNAYSLLLNYADMIRLVQALSNKSLKNIERIGESLQ